MSELGQREEIFRAARLAAPPLDRLGVLTFAGGSGKEVSLWSEAVFSRHLVPALLDARAAVTAGARELAAIDRRLDRALAGPLAANSREAGRRVLAESEAPAGERVLARYAEDVLADRSAGHLATVFGARTAIFHITPQAAVAALALVEMRSLPVSEVWTAVAHCWSGVPREYLELRAA